MLFCFFSFDTNDRKESYFTSVSLVSSVTNRLSPLLSHLSLPIYLYHFFSLPPLLFPPPTHTHTLVLPCSLSRSCKLQIRNIPPHMQWEVSANRLLTASRVGHYRAAQLGSHLGASRVTMPPFWVPTKQVLDDLFEHGCRSVQG